MGQSKPQHDLGVVVEEKGQPPTPYPAILRTPVFCCLLNCTAAYAPVLVFFLVLSASLFRFVAVVIDVVDCFVALFVVFSSASCSPSLFSNFRFVVVVVVVFCCCCC